VVVVERTTERYLSRARPRCAGVIADATQRQTIRWSTSDASAVASTSRDLTTRDRLAVRESLGERWTTSGVLRVFDRNLAR